VEPTDDVDRPARRAPEQSEGARRAPRRAPDPDERGRAADQTRERILAAAVAEFGAKGYSGARTAGIAARAGVNQQLISYYFGGKQGLLDELRRRWDAEQRARAPENATFAASVAAQMDATLDRPDWARLVIWQALGDLPEEAGDLVARQRERLGPAVERIRRRQAAGELTDAVGPEFVLLLAFAVTFAPIAMPQIVEAIFGVDPGSSQYRQQALHQLVTLLGADHE
jgi:TetR/AcrR family transcriptional regulator